MLSCLRTVARTVSPRVALAIPVRSFVVSPMQAVVRRAQQPPPDAKFAVVELGGKQYKVTTNDVIVTEKLPHTIGLSCLSLSSSCSR